LRFFRAAGSLFLFDRKAVRFFRKDGHNWQKKRDNKTVKETHEKLKARAQKPTRGFLRVSRGARTFSLSTQVGTLDALNWCAAAQQAVLVAVALTRLLLQLLLHTRGRLAATAVLLAARQRRGRGAGALPSPGARHGAALSAAAGGGDRGPS
jgi:hypothetical protein